MKNPSFPICCSMREHRPGVSSVSESRSQGLHGMIFKEGFTGEAAVWDEADFMT